MKFAAFHRCYLLFYIVDACLYIITTIRSTYPWIGMIENSVVWSHETYPPKFSHGKGCIVSCPIGYPCSIIGFSGYRFRKGFTIQQAFPHFYQVKIDVGGYPVSAYVGDGVASAAKWFHIILVLGSVFQNDWRNMLPDAPFASHVFHIDKV